MRPILFAALIVTSIPAAAQAPVGGPDRIEIDLSNFKFTPSSVTLHHGSAYVLHFANKAGGGHDFVAKAFFAAAAVAPADRGRVASGEIDLGGGEAADVRLVAPAPGRFEAHCSHFMHSTFGMRGEIIVN
jgi:uncharacterized cupredoxin-like copper-binding protein